MKGKITKVVTTIVILSLLPIFMGQDECELTETFKKEVVKKIEKTGNSANPVQVNVSFYPLINQGNIGETETTTNVNYLMASSLDMIISMYNDAKATFHLKKKSWNTILRFRINDDTKDTGKIIDTLFGPSKGGNDKKIKVINRLLGNSEDDIIITGRCYEDLTGELITIEIAALFRGHKKIETKRRMFQKNGLAQAFTEFKNFRLIEKDEIAKKLLNENIVEKRQKEAVIWEDLVMSMWTFFLEEDKTKKKKKSLKGVRVTYQGKFKIGDKDGEELDINKTLKALTAMKNQTPQPSGDKLYITHLSFINAGTMSAMVNSEFEQSINQAVITGMREAQKTIPKLVVNEKNHRLPNTEVYVNRLVNITFDPNYTRTEKIKRMRDQLMKPNGVDVIVTGHYIDDARNPLISLRPLVIVGSSHKIITKNLQFTKEELICKNPVKAQKELCISARDQIAQAVKELLEQL